MENVYTEREKENTLGILFSGMRISMAMIKANHEFHGPKIAESRREEKWALRLVSCKFEFCCDPLLSANLKEVT